MLTKTARTAVETDLRKSLDDQTKTTFQWLGRNATADFLVRLGLYLAAAFVLFQLILYVFSHADPMAGELLATRDANALRWWQTVGAVTWPIALLVVIAALCVSLGLYVQSRSTGTSSGPRKASVAFGGTQPVCPEPALSPRCSRRAWLTLEEPLPSSYG